MAGGECTKCAKQKLPLQRKLTIGAVDDPLEREADRVADEVMAKPAHFTVNTAPPRIQRFGDQGGGKSVNAPDSVIRVLANAGRPLEPMLRQDMEERFGYDFSQVRIHSGEAPAKSASEMNAFAYTLGNEIVFGAGQYAPDTASGRRLLAHELAHTLQQPAIGAPRIQRACGPAAIGRVSGCIGRGGDITDFGGTRNHIFLFEQNCDDFKPGEETRLRRIAAAIGPLDRLDVGGFASEEGDRSFNEELSCARAKAAERVLVTEGVAGSISLFSHGATPGDRESRRSTVITITASHSTPPVSPGLDPSPEPLPDESTTEETVPIQPECARNQDCPDDFCRPYPTREEAITLRDMNINGIVGIISAINSRAGPLFREYLMGGSATIRDLSGSLGDEFASDPVTETTTTYLKDELEAALRDQPPSFPPGQSQITLDIESLIPSQLRQIGDRNSDHAMNFTIGGLPTLAGLIAGGIGDVQSSCPVGANPSNYNDDRVASGRVDVFRNSDSSLQVNHFITYTVNDTIDFCPGNCGGFFAQFFGSTIDMSRYEATGIAGDLPFTVSFSAPSLLGAYDSEDW